MERSVSRTCIISGGLRKLHSTFTDGVEIVEEFNIQTNELISRKIKKSSKIGEGKWEWEVGEQIKSFNPESDDLRPSSSLNVIFT